VYGLFSLVENGTPFIVALIPYYNVAKLGTFIYLYHSSTRGATMVYDKVFVPYVVPYVSSAKSKSKKGE